MGSQKGFGFGFSLDAGFDNNVGGVKAGFDRAPGQAKKAGFDAGFDSGFDGGFDTGFGFDSGFELELGFDTGFDAGF